jgi:hypothetical protein
MNPFAWFDQRQVGGFRLWDFGRRSLGREYGWVFLWHAVMRHPVQFARGLRQYRRLIKSGLAGREVYAHGEGLKWGRGAETIVGVGFCLKPIDPPCPSGRANHDCQYFEQRLHRAGGRMAAGCARCKIRQHGLEALSQGCHFYIMTSALDIWRDLFLPALQDRRFRRGVFALCRYSFDPFLLPLLMANMEYALIPFASGDCRDYETWLQADVGIKDTQTVMADHHLAMFQQRLGPPGGGSPPPFGFRKIGNVFAPAPSD